MQRDLSSFAGALLDMGDSPPPGVHPAARFFIHRNNVLAGLVQILEARFPVTRRLVGDDFFAAMAREFVPQFPPQSPVLMEYGEALPEFLARFPPARELRYLPDVARLEWALHVAIHGPDASPIDAAALQRVLPERMADLCLDLHPTLALCPSPYPIVSIWRANQPNAATQIVPAGLPGEAALIVRPRLVAELEIVPDAAIPFIDGLLDGRALGEAALLATDPAFDLTAVLVLLLRSGAVTGFHLPN